MEGEWFPGVPESSQPQQITFVTMSTVDDLSYSPSEGQKTRDAAQVAATGRRSWKTLKGKPEAVWPPALEGALIEALEEYRKMEARPTTSKYGVRYPMRNRFISDFIFEKTGKTRTAKQVGSRLQQLRDTCKDGRLSSLLGKSGSQEPDCKAESSPTPSFGGRRLANSPTPPPEESLAIYVQLECPSERTAVPASPPQVHLKPNDMDSPYYLYLMPRSRHPADPMPPSYPTPSSTLSSFSSFVELVSPFPLSEETSWTVYKDKTLIHQEQTAIRMSSPLPTAAGRRVYICELVPSLWPMLCDTEDPNYITIVQKVRSFQETSSLANAVHTPTPVREVSIVYHFNVPDFSKLKLRPATSSYTVDNGLPSYATHPSPSSHPHHSSRTSYPDYGSSSPGHYWPSSGQDSYGYRDTGFSSHRRMHEPSLPDPEPTQPMASGHYNLDGSRWGQYGGVSNEADVFSPSLYGEPRSTQWEMNGLSPIAPAFNRRDMTSYNPLHNSCY